MIKTFQDSETGQLPGPNQDPNSSQQDLDDQADFLTTYEVESDLSSTDEDIKDVLQDASDGRPNEQSVHEKVSQNFFFKVGPNQSSFIYYNPFYRTYKYTMTQINFLPPPGFEPRSLGNASR